MIQVPHPEELKDFKLDEFEVPKYTERRGYLYILEDDVFPDFIKVGRSTSVQKRLYMYNSDKPYNTARMVLVSKLFENQNEAERKVLEYLYSVTPPTTLSREWFPKEYKSLIQETIEKLEASQAELEKAENDIHD